MNRLNPADDMFLKMNSVRPNLLLTQAAWVFDRPLHRDTWLRLDDHLAHGFAARRIRKTRVPFARPWFDRPIERLPVVFDEQPIPADGYLDWLRDKGDAPLDLFTGAVHQLAIAPTASGGQIVSYIASHGTCDGGGTMVALEDALGRLASGAAVSWEESTGRLVGTTPAYGRGRLRSHLSDSRAQVKEVRNAVRSAWQARKVTEPPRNPRPAEPRLNLPGEWTPPNSIVDVSLADWTAVAKERGGTVNGLFIAVSMGLLGRSGRIPDGATVRVDIPHSVRTGPEDPRGNAMSGLPISATYRSNARTDLKEIRAALKAAGTAAHDPANVPAMAQLGPIQMLVPAAVVPLFVSKGRSPELLTSNMGPALNGISSIDGIPAAKVVLRAWMRPVPADMFRQLEAGLHVTCANDDDTITLSVTGEDPDRFPTRAVQQALIVDELDAWGLKPTFWGS
ncbi:hypothetical protein EBN03_02610 [Nocardia stercoris]|uniref:Diacylglycerol O-acyltransferase n=1 Tax=Nocardia stercoris TaxID=2483361 RepID=A0A3M2LGV8_9NOCA|nr:hypothetical protein EBN03_02610 [Nocardia stercoris]